MSQRYFEDEDHAKVYAKFRNSPPEELISRVIGFLGEKVDDFRLAVDVGCGSGQNTNLLVPHFQKVLGSDISEAQVTEAKKKTTSPNVEFLVSPAEVLPFPPNSVQLLTSCVACHWFDLPNFYKEVERIVEPNGVIAFYCYTFPSLWVEERGDELNDAVKHVVHGVLGKYWGDGIKHIKTGYVDITIPCADVVIRESFDQVFDRSLADVFNTIRTFSAYQNMKKAEGDEAVQKMFQDFECRVREITGAGDIAADQIKLKMSEHWMLVMGRKPGVPSA